MIKESYTKEIEKKGHKEEVIKQKGEISMVQLMKKVKELENALAEKNKKENEHKYEENRI